MYARAGGTVSGHSGRGRDHAGLRVGLDWVEESGVICAGQLSGVIHSQPSKCMDGERIMRLLFSYLRPPPYDSANS
jgi:hypothetical protein